MKLLIDYDEAVREYFAGDHEAVRQAMIFHGLRALLEYEGVAEFAGCEDLQPNGDTPFAQWRTRRDGSVHISGWFYCDRSFAPKWVKEHGRLDGSNHLWAGRDTGVEFCGDFVVPGVVIGPLWFLESDLVDLTAPMQLEAPEAPKQPEVEKRPLGTRERNNLLRVISALSREAKIDLEAGSGAGQIAKALELAGFDGPKERTLRDLLKEVREVG